MKEENEIRKQLETLYEHRLGLRIGRMTRKSCRNCVRGVCREFDLGDFGSVTRWECAAGRSPEGDCGFQCSRTPEDIESEMLRDIADPAICGAKEQKIAMLIWVLRDCAGKGSSDDPLREIRSSSSGDADAQDDPPAEEGGSGEGGAPAEGCGLLDRLRRWFRG